MSTTEISLLPFSQTEQPLLKLYRYRGASSPILNATTGLKK